MLILWPSKVTFSLPFQFLKKSELLCLFFHFLLSFCFCVAVRIKGNCSCKSIYNCCHTSFKFFKLHRCADPEPECSYTTKDRGMGVGWTMDSHKCKDLILVHHNTVSLGLKSSATMTDGSIELESSPVAQVAYKTFRLLLDICGTCFHMVIIIDANIAAKLSPVG